VKPLRYSLHAETVIRQRNLDKRWIELTVSAPDWREADPADSEIERCYRSIPERGGRYLRVACVENRRGNTYNIGVP